MLRSTSKYRFRVVLACLLSICLSSATTESQRAGGLDDSRSGSKKVLFTFVTTSAPSVLLVTGERTRSHGFDNLLAIFHEQAHIVFNKESSPFHSDGSAEAIHFTDRSEIPIRASPFRKS
jgi:hypothetical protein